jgi:hypothetical protein
MLESTEALVGKLGLTYIRQDVSTGAISVRLYVGPEDNRVCVERMGKRLGEEPFAGLEEFKAYCTQLLADGLVTAHPDHPDKPNFDIADGGATDSFTRITTTHVWRPASELLKNRPDVTF